MRPRGAAHGEFTDICEWAKLTASFPDAPPVVVAYIKAQARSTCRPPNMAPARVHDLTNWYAIAFLERYLAGDRRYGTYLATFPPGPHRDVQVVQPKLTTSTPTTVPPIAANGAATP